MEYIYKVIPYQGDTREGAFIDEVSEDLTHTINEFASQDWEFVGIESVNVRVNPGCVGKFLGRKALFERQDQIIFRQKAKKPPQS